MREEIITVGRLKFESSFKSIYMPDLNVLAQFRGEIWVGQTQKIGKTTQKSFISKLRGGAVGLES